MSQNPYEPPKAHSVPPPVSLDPEEYQVASSGRRFANLLIDSMGYYALAFFIGMVLGVVGGLDMVNYLDGYPFGIFVIFLYYFPQELLLNRTLGKFVTGTKVVSRDRKPLTAARIAGRTLCRLVPFDTLSFLGRSPGWHDRWSNTRVVMVNRSELTD